VVTDDGSGTRGNAALERGDERTWAGDDAARHKDGT